MSVFIEWVSWVMSWAVVLTGCVLVPWAFVVFVGMAVEWLCKKIGYWRWDMPPRVLWAFWWWSKRSPRKLPG